MYHIRDLMLYVHECTPKIVLGIQEALGPEMNNVQWLSWRTHIRRQVQFNRLGSTQEFQFAWRTDFIASFFGVPGLWMLLFSAHLLHLSLYKFSLTFISFHFFPYFKLYMAVSPLLKYPASSSQFSFLILKRNNLTGPTWVWSPSLLVSCGQARIQ